MQIKAKIIIANKHQQTQNQLIFDEVNDPR